MSEDSLSSKRKMAMTGTKWKEIVPSADVKEFIKIIEDDIENAQEDYANLDWISKDQVLKIINKRAGEKLP